MSTVFGISYQERPYLSPQFNDSSRLVSIEERLAALEATVAINGDWKVTTDEIDGDRV
jgi:hypothetical protein